MGDCHPRRKGHQDSTDAENRFRPLSYLRSKKMREIYFASDDGYPVQLYGRWMAALVIPLCLVVGACSIFNTGSAPKPAAQEMEIGKSGPVRSSALSVLMAKSPPGVPASITDPRTGKTVSVIAERAYFAASGRKCRRFHVQPPGRYEDLKEGLACKRPSGQWALTRILVNPNHLGGGKP